VRDRTLFEQPPNTVHNAIRYADFAVGEVFRWLGSSLTLQTVCRARVAPARRRGSLAHALEGGGA